MKAAHALALLGLAVVLGASQATPPSFKCMGEGGRFKVRWWLQADTPWGVTPDGDTLAWWNSSSYGNSTMRLCAGKVSSVISDDPVYSCTDHIYAFGDYGFIFLTVQLVFSHDQQFFGVGNCLVDLRGGLGGPDPLPSRCLGPKAPVYNNVRTIISKFAEDGSGDAVFVVPVDQKLFAIKASEAFTEGSIPSVMAPEGLEPYQLAVSGSDIYWEAQGKKDFMKTVVCKTPLSSLLSGQAGMECSKSFFSSPITVDFSYPGSAPLIGVHYQGRVCVAEPSWLLKWEEGAPKICAPKSQQFENDLKAVYDPDTKVLAWNRRDFKQQQLCYATVTEDSLENQKCLLGGNQTWWGGIQNQGSLVGMEFGDLSRSAPGASSWLVVDAGTGKFTNGSLDNAPPIYRANQLSGPRISAAGTWFTVVADYNNWWFCQGPAIE